MGFFLRYDIIPGDVSEIIGGIKRVAICRCKRCEQATRQLVDPGKFIEVLQKGEVKQKKAKTKNNFIENILSRTFNPDYCVFNAQKIEQRNNSKKDGSYWVIKVYNTTNKNHI